jgi:hypothetical protein
MYLTAGEQMGVVEVPGCEVRLSLQVHGGTTTEHYRGIVSYIPVFAG